MGVIRRQSQSSLLFHGIVVFPYHTRYAFLVLLPKQGISAVASAVPILILVRTKRRTPLPGPALLVRWAMDFLNVRSYNQ
jgi:hypothetical protein